MPGRLVLADDHPIVLDGLEQMFRAQTDFTVVARCQDGTETLRALRQHRPGVFLVDIRMPAPEYEKLGLDGRVALTQYAREKGLL